MNAKIGELAKKWQELEKKFPSMRWPSTGGIPVDDEMLKKVVESHHANGKHETMVELFVALKEINFMTDEEVNESFIEEGSIEFENCIAVHLCGSGKSEEYCIVYFDGRVVLQ